MAVQSVIAEQVAQAQRASSSPAKIPPRGAAATGGEEGRAAPRATKRASATPPGLAGTRVYFAIGGLSQTLTTAHRVQSKIDYLHTVCVPPRDKCKHEHKHELTTVHDTRDTYCL